MSVNLNEIAKASQQLTSNFRAAVRLIAPAYGVDAEQLLSKLPDLPANSTEPDQLDAYFSDLRIKTEDMSVVEVQVMKVAHEVVEEILHAALKKQFAHLPEFSEYEVE